VSLFFLLMHRGWALDEDYVTLCEGLVCGSFTFVLLGLWVLVTSLVYGTPSSNQAVTCDLFLKQVRLFTSSL